MDVVIPHDTKLVSLSELPLQFGVQIQDLGLTIPVLKPRGEQLVNSSEILKISGRLHSASWPIEVRIDEQFSGLRLEAKNFLHYVIITFEFQRIGNGKYILVAEGAKEEKSIDTFLRMGRGIGTLAGRNRIWMKRSFEVIAKATPEYARTMSQIRVGNIGSNDDAIVPEAILDSYKMTSPPRNTTTGATTLLAGSILERGGRDSRFSGQHIADIEYYHHPYPIHSPSMDSFEFIFLFVLALVVVCFLKVQL